MVAFQERAHRARRRVPSTAKGQGASGGRGEVLALGFQLPDAGGITADVLLEGGCESGFGLPNGSMELPDFTNGSVEPPRSKIRLTKTHASVRSPMTLSRDCHTSRGL